jgi:hypothetical protein
VAVCGNSRCKARYTKEEKGNTFDNWCSNTCKDAIFQDKLTKKYETQNKKPKDNVKWPVRTPLKSHSTLKTHKPLTNKAVLKSKTFLNSNSTLKSNSVLKGSAIGSKVYNEEKKVRDVKRKTKAADSQLGAYIPVMTIKEAEDKAVAICHLFIRTRDADKPCPCCGKPLGPDFHAGHYIAAGSCSYLKYDERNIHGQRIDCNMFKYGDSGDYEKNLRIRIGDLEVEQLNEIANRNPITRRSLQDYMVIIDYYTQALHALRV